LTLCDRFVFGGVAGEVLDGRGNRRRLVIDRS